jgi:hypothetical protein
MKITLDNVSPGLIERLLNAILDGLRPDRRLPPLYRSGIRYRLDPGEVWQDPHTTARLGYGDCEDLALYRALELRGVGMDARVHVYRASPRTLHVVVRRPDGTLEDPSRALGMRDVRLGEDPLASAAMAMAAPAMQQAMQQEQPGMVNLLPMDPKTAAMMAASQVVPGGGLAVQLLASPEGRKLLRAIRKKFW